MKDLLVMVFSVFVTLCLVNVEVSSGLLVRMDLFDIVAVFLVNGLVSYSVIAWVAHEIQKAWNR